MTALAEDESPVKALELPGQTGVLDILKALWPELPPTRAWGSARTLIRLHGQPDAGALARLRMQTVVDSGDPAAIPEDFCIPLDGGLYLWKWTEDLDRRPRKGTPRWSDPDWAPGGQYYRVNTNNGRTYFGSAAHGECTSCVKSGPTISQALYRVADAANTYSRASLCKSCARKRGYLPLEVPQFGSPEEAQAWLDANS